MCDARLQAKPRAASLVGGLATCGNVCVLHCCLKLLAKVLEIERFVGEELLKDVLKPGYINQRIEVLKKRLQKKGEREAGPVSFRLAWCNLVHSLTEIPSFSSRPLSCTGSWT